MHSKESRSIGIFIHSFFNTNMNILKVQGIATFFSSFCLWTCFFFKQSVVPLWNYIILFLSSSQPKCNRFYFSDQFSEQITIFHTISIHWKKKILKNNVEITLIRFKMTNSCCVAFFWAAKLLKCAQMRRKAHHKYYEPNAYKSKVGWNKITTRGHILKQAKKWRKQAYYKPLNKMDPNMWMIDEAAVIQLIVWFESHYRFVNINLPCWCICPTLSVLFFS